MQSDQPQLARLIDRAAIYDRHAAYFRGLDEGNPDGVRACFADDVEARYDGRSALRPGGGVVRGVDAVMDSIITFKRKQSGEWKITTHFMGHVVFARLDQDVAETEVFAIAFIVLAGGDTDKVAMRSLRYLDVLRRENGIWRIAVRRHTLDWSCELPANFAATAAERVNASSFARP